MVSLVVDLVAVAAAAATTTARKKAKSATAALERAPKKNTACAGKPSTPSGPWGISLPTTRLYPPSMQPGQAPKLPRVQRQFRSGSFYDHPRSSTLVVCPQETQLIYDDPRVGTREHLGKYFRQAVRRAESCQLRHDLRRVLDVQSGGYLHQEAQMGPQ